MIITPWKDLIAYNKTRGLSSNPFIQVCGVIGSVVPELPVSKKNRLDCF